MSTKRSCNYCTGGTPTPGQGAAALRSVQGVHSPTTGRHWQTGTPVRLGGAAGPTAALNAHRVVAPRMPRSGPALRLQSSSVDVLTMTGTARPSIQQQVGSRGATTTPDAPTRNGGASLEHSVEATPSHSHGYSAMYQAVRWLGLVQGFSRALPDGHGSTHHIRSYSSSTWVPVAYSMAFAFPTSPLDTC